MTLCFDILARGVNTFPLIRRTVSPISAKMSGQNGTAPQRKYVTLVSKEGFEFVVLREATLVSPAIRSMLDPDKNFIEAQTGRCVFHDIRYVSNTAGNGKLGCPCETLCMFL